VAAEDDDFEPVAPVAPKPPVKGAWDDEEEEEEEEVKEAPAGAEKKSPVSCLYCMPSRISITLVYPNIPVFF
jgi:hypothetical protein